MTKKLLQFALLGLATIFCSAQNNPPTVSYSFLTHGVGAQSGYQMDIHTGVTNQLLSWVQVGSTTPTGCSVQVDSSPDGTTWTAGGIIAAQPCNTNGVTSLVTGIAAYYARISFTGITAGQVFATYTGSLGSLTQSRAISIGPTGSGTATLTASSTFFWSLGGQVNPILATEPQIEAPVPVSGTFCGLHVAASTNPPYTVAFTLRTGTNGSMSSTPLTCTLPTSGNKYCDDTADTATATEGAGNVMDMQVTTGAGTAAAQGYWVTVKVCGAS
jgi:hypothetical protein